MTPRPSATVGLTGYFVPFLLGIPSVRARVIGKTPTQYILHQMYETQNERGVWFVKEKIYYRDRDFIDQYWADAA